MTSELRIISGDIARVLCCGIGALALQPVLADPLVFEALALTTEAAAVIGVVTLAGWSRHKLLEWAAARPVMPAPSMVYATVKDMAPTLQQTAVQVMADDRQTEPGDDERRWLNAVQRFCVIGSSRGSFGWNAMRRHVDRTGWDTIKDALEAHGIIRIGVGRRPTLYSEGWDSARVRVCLKHGWLDMPTPASIPVVRW